jgi:beta-galactosidase
MSYPKCGLTPSLLASLFLALLAGLSVLHAEEKPPARGALPLASSTPLNGIWAFQLDPKSEGVNARWFTAKFADTIQLPGTSDEAKKGKSNKMVGPMHLTRVHPYQGPACYQREVEIPFHWREKRISLFLERTKNTTVWVNETEIGSQDTLVANQVFDLTPVLTPDRHRITPCLKNLSL